VFAMLANRYPMNKDASSLMTSLAANIGVELQLTVSFAVSSSTDLCSFLLSRRTLDT
jgi:hypothetical protein